MPETRTDLTAVGGRAEGNVLDSIVQEVDVATGKVLFEWHSLDHVPLTETYAPLLDPFDYFHVNSIDVDRDGNLDHLGAKHLGRLQDRPKDR